MGGGGSEGASAPLLAAGAPAARAPGRRDTSVLTAVLCIVAAVASGSALFQLSSRVAARSDALSLSAHKGYGGESGASDDQSSSNDDAVNDNFVIPNQPAASPDSEAIIIACIGASVTWGVCASDEKYTFPSRLQVMLDSRWGDGKFKVLNFGAPGSTMESGYDVSYTSTGMWRLAQSSGADIITLMLGSDDAGISIHWDEQAFVSSYDQMLNELRALPSKPHILPMTSPPFHHTEGDNNTFKDSIHEVASLMNLVLPDLIAGIAKDNGMKLIDIFKRFGGAHDPETPEHKSDTNKAWYCPSNSLGDLHPNDNGYQHIADATLPFIEELAAVIWRPQDSPKQQRQGATESTEGDDDDNDDTNDNDVPSASDDDVVGWEAPPLPPQNAHEDDVATGDGVTNDDLPYAKTGHGGNGDDNPRKSGNDDDDADDADDGATSAAAPTTGALTSARRR